MFRFTSFLAAVQAGTRPRVELLAELNFLLMGGTVDPVALQLLVLDKHRQQALPDDLLNALLARIALQLDTTRTQYPATSTAAQATVAPTAESDAPAAIGTLMSGRFVLTEVIGRGSMGVVYRGIDHQVSAAESGAAPLAIKVLYIPNGQADATFRALQELLTRTSQLSHPNIANVLSADCDGNVVILTSQYLSGEPLTDRLNAQGSTATAPQEAMAFISQIGAALTHAHAHQVVHGDLKPSNLLICDASHIKVLDFGIARVCELVEDTTSHADTDFANDQTVFDGRQDRAITAAYASPQVLNRLEPQPTDDVFSLACIAYELLAGVHPFSRARSVDAEAAAISPKRPPGLRNRQWRGLRQALAFEAQLRPQSIAAFLTLLLPDAAAKQPVVWPWRSSVHWLSHRLKPAPRWLIIAAAGSLVLAGFAALFFSSPAADGPTRLAEPAATGSVQAPTQPLSVNAPSSIPEPSPALIRTVEVTNEQFRAYVEDAKPRLEGCQLKASGWTDNRSLQWTDAIFNQNLEQPVSCVSQRDAQGYARWYSAKTGMPYRLPTPSEVVSSSGSGLRVVQDVRSY